MFDEPQEKQKEMIEILSEDEIIEEGEEELQNEDPFLEWLDKTLNELDELHPSKVKFSLLEEEVKNELKKRSGKKVKSLFPVGKWTKDSRGVPWIGRYESGVNLYLPDCIQAKMDDLLKEKEELLKPKGKTKTRIEEIDSKIAAWKDKYSKKKYVQKAFLPKFRKPE